MNKGSTDGVTKQAAIVNVAVPTLTTTHSRRVAGQLRIATRITLIIDVAATTLTIRHSRRVAGQLRIAARITRSVSLPSITIHLISRKSTHPLNHRSSPHLLSSRRKLLIEAFSDELDVTRYPESCLTNACCVWTIRRVSQWGMSTRDTPFSYEPF
jgi:hypothetical protein